MVDVLIHYGRLRRRLAPDERGGKTTVKSIAVGRVEIVALTDVEGPFFRLSQLFPGVGS